MLWMLHVRYFTMHTLIPPFWEFLASSNKKYLELVLVAAFVFNWYSQTRIRLLRWKWGTTIAGFLMETLIAREYQCLDNYRNIVNRVCLAQLLCIELAQFKIHIQIRKHKSSYLFWFNSWGRIFFRYEQQLTGCSHGPHLLVFWFYKQLFDVQM